MLNIMNADMFRVRKGKSIMGVVIGLLAIILLMATISKILASEELLQELESGSGPVSIETTEDDFIDEGADQVQENSPTNGTEFWIEVYEGIVTMLPIFLLPLIIVIFGADYSSGAFRNLLSYHSERDKVYLSKLFLSFLVGIGMKVVLIVMSLIIGTLFFGAGSVPEASLIQAITGTLLMIPTLLATISLGHCIVALTKKVSSTIAIFIVGMFGWTMLIQIVAMTFQTKPWIINLDIVSMMGSMMHYPELTTGDIVMQMFLSMAVLIVTIVVGMYKYRKTDFNFN